MIKSDLPTAQLPLPSRSGQQSHSMSISQAPIQVSTRVRLRPPGALVHTSIQDALEIVWETFQELEKAQDSESKNLVLVQFLGVTSGKSFPCPGLQSPSVHMGAVLEDVWGALGCEGWDGATFSSTLSSLWMLLGGDRVL